MPLLVLLQSGQVDESGAETAPSMTAEEAVSWLRQVDGDLYRTPPGRRGREAWVAVVRTPGGGSLAEKTIVALGDTPQEATSVAATRWRERFRDLGPFH